MAQYGIKPRGKGELLITAKIRMGRSGPVLVRAVPASQKDWREVALKLVEHTHQVREGKKNMLDEIG